MATSETTESILVLGAGELGTPILRELSKSQWGHHHITVLLRPSTIASTDTKKQSLLKELRELGIHFLPGDLATSTTSVLAQLFQGFHTIISATGYIAGPGTQLKLARAVLQAGIPRYFPWQFGVDYDTIGKGSAQELFDEQLDVRTLLRAQSRTEWVIISTGVFMNFLFSPFFGVVDLENAVVHALGSFDNRITVTTVEDIGRLTAAIVFAEPRIKNTVLFTAGDTLSYNQVADIVDAVLKSQGRKARRDVWELSTLQEKLGQEPDDVLKKYAVVFAAGRGVAWDVEQTYNGRHNIPVVDAKQWAIQNL
ncbi:Isoflavone reductase IRL [Hypsizygus marmoreus]|uniref:Isoflavone reductase IRL n=1 Tax=Hypsizygus marmoreus TaxID=39966 RepID=A0A369J4U6_HYPMA|nr:Isoflavone reductase IRL [Hypsizygus marmoreus]